MTFDRERFFAAVRSGNLAAVRSQLKDAKPWLLARAIGDAPFGDEKLVRLLLSKKPPLDEQSPDTVLYDAVAAGDEVKVRLLLAAGADPELADDKRWHVPLGTAVATGALAIAKLLLDAGAKAATKNSDGYALIDLAAAQGNTEMVKLLRAKRAKPSAKPPAFPLVDAADYGIVDRVRALLPKAKPADRDRALVLAAQAGRATTVAAILEASKSPSAELGTALYQASQNGHASTVDVLLAAKGLDLEAKSKMIGRTALMTASELGRTAVVERLLAAGAKVATRSSDGDTALSLAKRSGRADIVALLEKGGADPAADAKLAAKVLAKVKPLTRTAHVPKFAKKATPRGSQLGGAPFLVTGETWPACPTCGVPMPLVAQLDLAALPSPLASRGTAQLFYCTPCDTQRSHLARVLPAAAKGATASKPPRGTKLLPLRPIAAWTPIADLPYRDPALAKIEFPVERTHLETILFEHNAQGDKLGGWPCWVQDPAYVKSDRLLLQLASTRARMWGDNGCAYLMQAPRDPTKLRFLYQTP